MKHFTVVVEGRGFTINVEGNPTAVGFFTPRWVYAFTKEEACEKAIALVQSEEKFRTLARASGVKAVLSTSEVHESSPEVRGDAVPGYSLYREDSKASGPH